MDGDETTVGEILSAIEPDDDTGIGDVIGDVSIGDAEVGSFFSKIVHSIHQAASAVVHSPILKVTSIGVGFAFPPAVGATTALIAADRILAVADGTKKATPKQREEMKKAIAVTAAHAKQGDPEAQKAVEFMTLSRQLRASTKGHPVQPPKLTAVHKKSAIHAPLVHPDGRIERGTWLRV